MPEGMKVDRVLSIYKKDLVVLRELAGQRNMSLTRYLNELIEAHAAEYRTKWVAPAPTVADGDRIGTSGGLWRKMPKREEVVIK